MIQIDALANDHQTSKGCHVMLVPAGSHGDVYPLLGLGKRLAERGHTLSIIANEPFRPLVERMGFAFLQMRSTAELRASQPTVWHPRKSWGAMADRMEPEWRRQYRLICEHGRGSSTVVVANGAAFGARLAQERDAISLATVHLAPLSFRSSISTPLLHPALWWLNRIPVAMKPWIFRQVDRQLDRAFVPGLNRLRIELGLPTLTRPFDGWWNSPELVLALFPKWFCPPQADWPPNTIMGDFVRFTDPSMNHPDQAAEEFFSQPDPLVVFTPGTSAADTSAFVSSAISACQRLGCRGLILSRRTKDLPRELPPGIRHYPHLPFGQVFPHCRAVVYHGGIGTMAEVMAAGVPHLVLPKAFDQFDNAARVRQLGIGAAIAFGGNRGGKTLARQLDRLIHDTATRANCLAVQQHFRFAAKLDLICDRISQLAAK